MLDTDNWIRTASNCAITRVSWIAALSELLPKVLKLKDCTFQRFGKAIHEFAAMLRERRVVYG